MALPCQPLLALASADTTGMIIQADTTICKGASLDITLRSPKPKDTMLPGVWKQLIGAGAIDQAYFNIKPFGYDRTRQYLYSVFRRTIIRYDLKQNKVTTIPSNNWPGDYSEFVYDFTNDRILCWRSGRDNIYALPAQGGNWTLLGPGVYDNECYGASPFWNPLTSSPGFYGGYGSAQVKSWIYEHNGTGWQLKKNNPAIDMNPPKGGNVIASNADGSKLYLFSGQGNYSGSELTGACLLGSPWANAGGIFCWLRDLWEIDLNTYQFKNILPVNDPSIQYEGAVAYDYDKNRFFLFGGFQPTGDYVMNQLLTNTDKTFQFRVGKDAGFVEFKGEGAKPPAMPRTSSNNYAYYDPVDKRVIWARFDGIWAYYPDSSAAPKPDTTYLWSNGATTKNITVKPDQNTQYRVTRTIGTDISMDTINVAVKILKTSLVDTVKHCGDSILLDAGPGFVGYQWNNSSTAQSLWAKAAGKYWVTVSDNECSATDTTIVQLALPVEDFQVKAALDSVCPGTRDSLYIVAPQSNIIYEWMVPGNPAVIKTGNYVLVDGIKRDTSFIIRAKADPDVCPVKGSTVTIAVRHQLPAPVVRDSATATSLFFDWDPIQWAQGYSVSRDSGLSYTAPSTGVLGLRHVINDLQPNESVRLWVKALGVYACENSDSVKIVARTLNPFGEGIYIPNAFTPNGDGNNDLFTVYSTTIVSGSLIIYNQWGQQLYETTDLRKGWDGTYKGNRAVAGRYTYSLDAIMQSGQRVQKAGSFSLLR